MKNNPIFKKQETSTKNNSKVSSRLDLVREPKSVKIEEE